MRNILRILILTVFLVVQPALAGLPPTRSGGQSDTLSTTFDFQAPLSQITKTSGTAGLIETGNYNLLKNPGFEGQTLVGWSVSGLSGLSTLDSGLGKQALSFYTTGAAQTFTSDSFTIPPAYYGQNGELTCAVKHAGSAVGGNIGLNASAGTIDQKIELSQASGTYQYFKINFVFPTSGTLNVIGTSGSPYGESFVDDCYLGLARNVAQCGVDTPWVSFTPSWTTNAGTLPTVSTDQGWWRRVGDSMEIRIFRLYTGAGTGGGVHILTVPGGRTIDLSGSKMSTAVGGTGTQGQVGSGSWYDDTLAATQGGISVSGFIWSSTQIGVIPNGSASTGVNTLFGNNDRLAAVFKVPIVGWTASQCVTPEQQRAPKVTVYTSGSGTHTWSSGVTYAEIEMVGGGGGGAGSGTASGGSGGAGGNTTFAGLLTANGGAGGVVGTGISAGGSVSVASPAVQIMAVAGASGGGTQYDNLAAGNSGGAGASSCRGGAGGQASYSSPGFPAKANSGSGGGGAAANAAVGGSYTGQGGAAGGCIRAQIIAPSGTAAYAVGAAGSAGSAGTNGYAGGAGSAGEIVVTEYFGYTTAILANSVSTDVTNGLKVTTTRFTTTTGPNACVVGGSIDNSWISGTPSSSGPGQCSFTMTGFSAQPDCQFTLRSSPSGISVSGNTSSATAGGFQIWDALGAATTGSVVVTCIGPR